MKIYVDPEGSSNLIIVITHTGIIRKLYTPFKVVCIIPVWGISTQTQVYVDAVYSTTDGKILYVIFNRTYHHSHFSIFLK